MAAVVQISLLEPVVATVDYVKRVRQIRVAAVLIVVPVLVTVSHAVRKLAPATAARSKMYAATVVMMLNATGMTVSDGVRPSKNERRAKRWRGSTTHSNIHSNVGVLRFRSQQPARKIWVALLSQVQ